MGEEDPRSRDAIYRDRNLLACALAQATHAPSGWYPDPENRTEWALVWIATPMGEVSWHVPRELVEDLGLRRKEIEYTGYSTDEKNDRLAAWAAAGCRS